MTPPPSPSPLDGAWRQVLPIYQACDLPPSICNGRSCWLAQHIRVHRWPAKQNEHCAFAFQMVFSMKIAGGIGSERRELLVWPSRCCLSWWLAGLLDRRRHSQRLDLLQGVGELPHVAVAHVPAGRRAHRRRHRRADHQVCPPPTHAHGLPGTRGRHSWAVDRADRHTKTHRGSEPRALSH